MNSARIFSSSVFLPAVSFFTSARMASSAAFSRGRHRALYHLEISSQFFAVPTRSRCTAVYRGGISGSGIACGTSTASHL